MMDYAPGGYQVQQTGPDEYTWALKEEATKKAQMERAAAADRYVKEQMGGQYEGVDPQKAAELQKNIEAQRALEQRPDWVAEQQAAEKRARDTGGDAARQKEYRERGLEPGPMELSPEGKELREQGERRKEYEERGLKPGRPGEQTLPEYSDLQPYTSSFDYQRMLMEQQKQQAQPGQPPPQPPPPQPPQPQAEREPSREGAGATENRALVNAIKSAMQEVMSKYWS